MLGCYTSFIRLDCYYALPHAGVAGAWLCSYCWFTASHSRTKAIVEQLFVIVAGQTTESRRH